MRSKTGLDVLHRALLQMTDGRYHLTVWGHYKATPDKEERFYGEIDDVSGESLRVALLQTKAKIPGNITKIKVNLDFVSGAMSGTVDYTMKDGQTKVVEI